MSEQPYVQNPQNPQQTLLAQALACAANAVFITDEVGQIIWINGAFTKLTGYTLEDSIGRTPAMLKSGRQNDGFYATLWQTIVAGQTWKGEIVDQHKDGTHYTVDEVITPLFDDKGVIKHFLAIQHDITLKKQQSEHDHHLAYHDVLTDLPNRALFLEALKKAIAHANRTLGMFATLFLDLDGFKPINDRFGHHVGDQLLRAVAERLRGTVRDADTVARFGGDEFAILISELVDNHTVTALAKKLIESISRPFDFQGQRIDVRISIGIAMYPPDGDDPETLLIHADMAMYEAKSCGGNDARFYHQDLGKRRSILESNVTGGVGS